MRILLVQLVALADEFVGAGLAPPDDPRSAKRSLC